VPTFRWKIRREYKPWNAHFKDSVPTAADQDPQIKDLPLRCRSSTTFSSRGAWSDGTRTYPQRPRARARAEQTDPRQRNMTAASKCDGHAELGRSRNAGGRYKDRQRLAAVARPSSKLRSSWVDIVRVAIMSFCVFGLMLFVVRALALALPQRSRSLFDIQDSTAAAGRMPLSFTPEGTFQLSIFEDLHFGESMPTPRSRRFQDPC
jgi:hypothetical protein